ncbi:hypothetical protein QS431_11370 [Staphylococcus pseudintermedius]|uniref:hypothetical protein n=1 Tax=Staphylococcus pseudintermedius TaxID=283734 RepID=UPI00286E3EA8|nr:hypothetical protein [Staphylococcus pseudintermedius]WMZ59423.1 hypothetical protein QS431_11370 [Staphylococcus pseudintermedius]
MLTELGSLVDALTEIESLTDTLFDTDTLIEALVDALTDIDTLIDADSLASVLTASLVFIRLNNSHISSKVTGY